MRSACPPRTTAKRSSCSPMDWRPNSIAISSLPGHPSPIGGWRRAVWPDQESMASTGPLGHTCDGRSNSSSDGPTVLRQAASKPRPRDGRATHAQVASSSLRDALGLHRRDSKGADSHEGGVGTACELGRCQPEKGCNDGASHRLRVGPSRVAPGLVLLKPLAPEVRKLVIDGLGRRLHGAMALIADHRPQKARDRRVATQVINPNG